MNSRTDGYAEIIKILGEMVKRDSRGHHLISYESSQEEQIALSWGACKDFVEESL